MWRMDPIFEGMKPGANNERIFRMPFASVYPHYVTKVEKKGRTREELHTVIRGLTASTEKGFAAVIDKKVDFKTFLAKAPRTLVILLFSLSVVPVFAHEDRHSHPNRFTITLGTGERMESEKFTPEMQEAITLKGLKTAQVKFKTGEVLHLEWQQYWRLSSMSIQLGERRCSVPDSAMIHLSPQLIATLELSWPAESKRPSTASYFAIHCMRMNERRVPAEPLFFTGDCARIGGWAVLDELILGTPSIQR